MERLCIVPVYGLTSDIVEGYRVSEKFVKSLLLKHFSFLSSGFPDDC